MIMIIIVVVSMLKVAIVRAMINTNQYFSIGFISVALDKTEKTNKQTNQQISMINDEHGRFFPTHVTLQSHEDTRAYANVYSYVKEHLGQARRQRLRSGDSWRPDGSSSIPGYELLR